MIFFKFTALIFCIALLSALFHRIKIARFLLCSGCLIGIGGVLFELPNGTFLHSTPLVLASFPVYFQLNGAALCLMGFGLMPALFACWTGNTTISRQKQRVWLSGISCILLGALGVFGLQDAISFFIAWEVMSFGTAILLLAESNDTEGLAAIFFMLTLLETSAIALLIAFLLLGTHSANLSFAYFSSYTNAIEPNKQLLIGLLLLIGFGTKLGLLPFYEWIPKAYAAGSGASGAINSGIALNAAFFAFMRAMITWLPTNNPMTLVLSFITVVIGAGSAVIVILNGFQQTDWRKLLGLSSAENASIGVLTIGVALLFLQAKQANLAGFSGAVALIVMAGDSLAKGALFLTADSIYHNNKSYFIAQNGLLKKGGALLGIGASFAAMSLSAIPPQAGFVSEWYVFQSLFQGLFLDNIVARLTVIVGSIGVALTTAIALATMVKAFGVGLLGASAKSPFTIPRRIKIAVFILGFCVFIFSIGLFFWMKGLSVIITQWFQSNSIATMHAHLLLIPTTAQFGFISPTVLAIAILFLILIPITLLVFNKRYPVKRTRIWTGGTKQNPQTFATIIVCVKTFLSFLIFTKRRN